MNSLEISSDADLMDSFSVSSILCVCEGGHLGWCEEEKNEGVRPLVVDGELKAARIGVGNDSSHGR